MRWDSLKNWVPSLLDRVRYEKYFLETLPSVLQQLLAFGSRAIKPIQTHFWSQSHFYHLLESEIKTASQLILWNQNLVLNFKYYVVESFKYFIVIKTLRLIRGANIRFWFVDLQGPRAEAMMRSAMERGKWVFFQNCHLAPSWMPSLERLIEQIDPDKVSPESQSFIGFRLL